MSNLPKISEPQKQEDRSIKRFCLLVDDNVFFVRDVRTNDFGVDLRLELIIDRNNMTNITIDAQIKSTKTLKLKDDHSLTFSDISVSNLNYLLNSPYSIYVIYLETQDIFFWDYCTNIKEYCENRAISINTTTQKTFSYNFTKILNTTSIGEIHNEIRYRYNDLLLFSRSNLLLTEKNSTTSDVNISKNIDRSKQALEYYLNIIKKESRLSELMQLTLYNIDEICTAREKGIVTSRLANGLIKTVGANLSTLIGEIDISAPPINRNHIIYTSTFDDIIDSFKMANTPDDIIQKTIHDGIQFSDSESLINRVNLVSRYEYMKKLRILKKLTRTEYNNLCSMNLNSRDGLSYKTVTQLVDFRFNDNFIESSDGSYHRRYFILDFRESAIIDDNGSEQSNEIYEVDLYTFYLLLSEIWSAKQDIEDGINITEANNYLVHMQGIISELLSV